jgi:hypothetical protein
VSERAGQNVCADHLAPLRLKGANQGFAEMAGTAGHQNRHGKNPLKTALRQVR